MNNHTSQTLADVLTQNAQAMRLFSILLNGNERVVNPQSVKDITSGCEVTEQYAVFALLCVALGIDDEEDCLQSILANEYLRPSLMLLDKAAYASNPYLNTIKLPSISSGSWSLCSERYEQYELFVRDNIVCTPELREIPLIGCFPCAVEFPAVLENGREWMAIKPNEIESMAQPVARAFGNVLTYGLGLGYFAFMVSQKSNVSSITVVEKDSDVISLFNEHILPQFPHKEKLRIICDDAFAYAKRRHSGIDFTFADIWHDAADGLELYLRMRAHEHYNPTEEYCYWTEPTFLSLIRQNTFCELSDAELCKLSASDFSNDAMRERSLLLARCIYS